MFFYKKNVLKLSNQIPQTNKKWCWQHLEFFKNSNLNQGFSFQKMKFSNHRFLFFSLNWNSNWMNLRDAETGKILWELKEDVSRSDKEFEGKLDRYFLETKKHHFLWSKMKRERITHNSWILFSILPPISTST